MFVAVGIVIVAVAFAVRFRDALKEYRRIEPIRQQVRARPVTFRTSAAVRIGRPSREAALRGSLDLIVRGEFLEISHPFRWAAALFGQEYYFRAADLEIETYRDQQERIRITDISNEGDASLLVANRADLGGIWHALVNAGAVPVGQAPGPRRSQTLSSPTGDVSRQGRPAPGAVSLVSLT